MLARLFHVPYNSFDRASFLHLGEWAGPKFTSLLCLSAASRVRTALKTMVNVWPLIVDQVELHASVNMAGGLRGVFLGTPWPDFWDTRSFAFVLREATGRWPII